MSSSAPAMAPEAAEAQPQPAPTASFLLFRAPVRFPCASLLLIASCFLVTLPLMLNPRRYYPILGVSDCEIDFPVRWWHYLVTPFVHGAGCGFPPTWFHILVNVSLFAFHGILIERLLGTWRFSLVTIVSLCVQMLLKYLIVEGRGHGASGMTWSYVLFVAVLLAWWWKDTRWRMLRDWVAALAALWLAFAILGLLQHWHLWNLLVSVPFFFAWRGTLKKNFESIRAGNAAIDGGPRALQLVGVALPAALLAFNAVFVTLAVLGRIS